MEWLLILTIKYHSGAISVTAINMPSAKACIKAGTSWANDTDADFSITDFSTTVASFTCSPMIKDK